MDLSRKIDSTLLFSKIDSVLRSRDTLLSLDTVLAISDSVFLYNAYLRFNHYKTPARDSEFGPGLIAQSQRAYFNLLAYQRGFALNRYVRGKPPLLMNEAEAKDSLLRGKLPAPGVSNYLQEGRFFFLGGSPLVWHDDSEDDSLEKDGNGHVLAHYRVDRAENTNKLLASMLYAAERKVIVGFGGGYVRYDVGPIEVHGIGSLDHRFETPVPVYFLTKKGAVPGSLHSIEVKIAKDYICMTSEFPAAKFSSTLSPDEKILGIYIPYDFRPPPSCVMKRLKNGWTLDLNGDQIPDLGCLFRSYEGCVGDQIYSLSWFANVNGEWKPIDSGVELDCT